MMRPIQDMETETGRSVYITRGRTRDVQAARRTGESGAPSEEGGGGAGSPGSRAEGCPVRGGGGGVTFLLRGNQLLVVSVQRRVPCRPDGDGRLKRATGNTPDGTETSPPLH